MEKITKTFYLRSRNSVQPRTGISIDEILSIKFGDIDGMYDPCLENYFLDRDYWEKIINGYKYFVIGRKGTGKSALYNWLKKMAERKGALCSNILFNDFPLQKLYGLKDETFERPHQFQTICKNMILSEFCKMIALDAECIVNDSFEFIKKYNALNNTTIEDCFRKSVTTVVKDGVALKLPEMIGGSGISLKNQQQNEYSLENPNLHAINALLEKAIVNYFKIYNGKKKFFIQIDGIDENYTQLATKENILDDYFEFVVGLLKTTYLINQKFHAECGDCAKCIVYLRDDIFNRIHSIDAESARWEQQMEFLNWTIQKPYTWEHNDLRELINKRISNSLPKIKDTDAFAVVFDTDKIHLTQGHRPGYIKRINNLFEYMIIRTFHRPRDLIQFCIKIQDEVRKTYQLSWKEFKAGEREYSLWFLNEITNEISPIIQDTDSLFKMLRSLGSKPFPIGSFKTTYERYKANIKYSADELLQYLYDLGVIYNINDNGKIFTSMRNNKSRINPDIKIALHAGFWQGLYTSTF